MGFGTFKKTSVPIEANAIARVNAKLAAGSVTQEVKVTAATPLLQTDTAETSFNLTEQMVDKLPEIGTAGSNFQALYLLVPGAAPPVETNSDAASPSRSMTTNVNGTSSSAISTRIDGALDQHPWLPANVAYTPPIDAIQSVNIVTSDYNPEQGIAGGAAVSVILKSGTDQFHGTMFGYNSIAQFNARDYFNTPAQTPKLPKYILNQYGGSIGGPIIKDKLFFFADWNSVHRAQSLSEIGTVPVAALRTGNFSAVTTTTIYNPFTGDQKTGKGKTAFPGNQVPVSSVAATLMKNLPLPNYGGVGATVNNYFASADTTFRRDQIDAKLNYNVSDKTTFYGHYSTQPSLIHNPTMFGINPEGNILNPSGGQPGESEGDVQMASISGTHAFTPRLLMDATAGYTRLYINSHADDLVLGDYGTKVLGIPGTNNNGQYQYGGIPGFSISGYSGIGGVDSSSPFEYRDSQYTGNINLSYGFGRHQLRFGGEYIHSAMNHFQPSSGNPRGSFTFDGDSTVQYGTIPDDFNAFAAFLVGSAHSASKAIQYANPETLRWSIFGFYAGDTWAALPSLTITYGARYEYYTVPVRDHSGLYRVDPDTTVTVTDHLGTHKEIAVLIGGKGGIPNNTGVENGPGMIVPRLGVNYRVNDKTVLRSGYGITVDPQNLINMLPTYPTQLGLSLSAPNSYTYATTYAAGFTVPSLPDISTGIVPLPYNDSTNPLPKIYRRGYIESYNADIQRQLPLSLVADVAYIGTLSIRQLCDCDINASPIGGGNAGRVLNVEYGPNTNDANLHSLIPKSNANYSGLQAQLRYRNDHGVNEGVVYTYSKTEDYYDNGIGVPMFNSEQYFNLNHGLAGYDRKHNFEWFGVFPLPFGKKGQFLRDRVSSAILGGWSVQHTLSWYSGEPFTVSASTSQLNTEDNANFAQKLVSKVPIYGAHHYVGPNIVYFEPTAFGSSPANAFGNSGRNSLRGPGTFRLNLGLSRSFPLWENSSLEFRAEAFNATNTPSFANPGKTTLKSAGFGTITESSSVNANRQIRLGAKIRF